MHDVYERIAALSPKKRALLALRLNRQMTIDPDRQEVSSGVGLGANPEQVPTAAQLRHFLLEKLPDYMVPSAFVMLDALPLTPSGKVDRRGLPAHDLTRPEVEETPVAPHTALETLIAEVWREALQVEHVGVYDNFFDLGGHSLLAMRVVAKIEKQIGLRINPGEMFGQTLGQLAAACEEQWAAQLQQSVPTGFTQKLLHALKRAVFPKKR